MTGGTGIPQRLLNWVLKLHTPYTMKKILSIAVAVFLFSVAYAQKKSADTRLQDVDKELQQVLDTWKAAGFAVAVVEKNKVVYAKGFGYRDYEKKLNVTPNTLFAIGSCTKAFTA